LNANMAATKMRWGDTLDEDMGDELPPPSVVGPDAKGVKITTTYRKNDKGETVKTVIKTKFTKVERKAYQVCMIALKMPDEGKTQVSLPVWHKFHLHRCMLPAVSARAKRVEKIWRCDKSAARAQCDCPVARRCTI